MQTNLCLHFGFCFLFTIQAKELDSLILETKSSENKVPLGFFCQHGGCSEADLTHHACPCACRSKLTCSAANCGQLTCRQWSWSPAGLARWCRTSSRPRRELRTRWCRTSAASGWLNMVARLSSARLGPAPGKSPAVSAGAAPSSGRDAWLCFTVNLLPQPAQPALRSLSLHLYTFSWTFHQRWGPVVSSLTRVWCSAL